MEEAGSQMYKFLYYMINGGRERVGLGITTRNRREKSLQAIGRIKQLSPDSFKTVVSRLKKN